MSDQQDKPTDPTPPALVLIHGLGATRGVWSGVGAELDWPGPVIVPDLPGHGAAPWQADYTVGALAAAVSADCQPGQEVVIVGHSLGGAVGLCLASGFFRPTVRLVVGLGIKVNWSAEDVAGVAKVAAKGIRWFETEAEAQHRFLLQSGLAAVGAGHPIAETALVDAVATGDGGWRVAQDPMTFAQKALDTAGLVAAATCPVVLGAGSDDQMVAAAELAAYVPQPRMADGRGHNVHVEDPAWVTALLHELVEANGVLDRG
ncbi:MAG: alpha/beta fold hydrolase [Actinomycetota bacterium]